MKPLRLTVTPAAADRDGIATAQTTVGAGNLTLDGALAGTLAIPGHVSVYSAGNISTVTFTVTGTDRYGRAISEDIVGPDTTPDTNVGSLNFATVTQVYADGAVGTDVEIGSADEFETQWVPVDYHSPVGSVQVELSTGAGLTWEWQSTNADIADPGFQESDVAGIADATLTGQTTSARGGDSLYASATRIAVTGYTSGSFTAVFYQGLYV